MLIKPFCRKLKNVCPELFVFSCFGGCFLANLFQVLMKFSGLRHFNEDTAFGFINQKLFRTFAPVSRYDYR